MPDQMWKWLDAFPRQIEHAAQLGETWDLSGIQKPQNVVFLGIGGSAIGATLVCDLYKGKFSCPVMVSRGDQPPAWIDERSLAVAISYSGETQETLTAFRRSLESSAQGVSVSSGGNLAHLAEVHKLPHLVIPEGMAPRAALGYTSLPLIFLLQKIGVIPTEDLCIDSLIDLLDSLRDKWNVDTGPGAGDAQLIHQRLPIIIGGGLITPIVRRFQAQLAENAKTISILFEIPESLHNLVETLSKQNIDFLKPVIIELEDPQAPDTFRSLVETLREFIERTDFQYIRLYAEGNTPQERLYSLIYKTDWISYYLARIKK